MTRRTTVFDRRHLDGTPIDRPEPSDHEPTERTWCATCGGPLTAGACPTHGRNR